MPVLHMASNASRETWWMQAANPGPPTLIEKEDGREEEWLGVCVVVPG